MSILEIKDLTKTYKGGKKAVCGLNLTVEAGDIYAFIGHNGAGKTTTIKAVVGIHSFDSGSIRIDGHSVREEPMICKKITAYVPDNPDLCEYLTGIQYLRFLADVFGVESGIRKQRIEEYTRMFGIETVLGDLISSYSHGMKQKLALTGALLHDPKLLVLDEPFVGLDPEAAVMLKDVMRKRCQNGAAIFFSTHVLDTAEKLCNKAAIIQNGSLVAAGGMAELTKGESLESVFMEVVGHAKTD